MLRESMSPGVLGDYVEPPQAREAEAVVVVVPVLRPSEELPHEVASRFGVQGHRICDARILRRTPRVTVEQESRGFGLHGGSPIDLPEEGWACQMRSPEHREACPARCAT